MTTPDTGREIETVGYCITGLVPSKRGYVTQTVRMCEAFAGTGRETTLYCPDRYQDDPTLREADVFEFYGVTDRFTIERLSFLDPFGFPEPFDEWVRRPVMIASNLGFALNAGLRLRGRDVDLAVTRHWLVAVVLVLLGVPTVFEVHKVEGTSFSPRARRAITAIADRDALVALVTLTEPTADGLSRLGIPRSKIHVEPDGVDLSQYEASLSRLEARAQLDLPTDERIVAYTGSFHPGKGVRPLVVACADLDIRVLLVGDDPEQHAELERFLAEREIDNVDLVEAVPPADVPRYQWAADVLTLTPTADEKARKHHPQATSPLKLFEYMAAERPIVASALPGITSVLTDREDALLVQPGETDAIREAVETLLRDETLADSLAAAATETVTDYTWETRAERIANVIASRHPRERGGDHRNT